MKATASISIDRPVNEVFDYITNVENMPTWVTGVSGARMVSQAMEKGARYVLDYVAGWRSSEVEIEVVGYERPRLFASRTSRGPFDYEGRMELAGDDTSTSITNIIEDDPDSVASQIAAWVFGPLVRGARRRRMERELEKLRTVIGLSRADDSPIER